MPVEIKELIVRAIAVQEPSTSADSGRGTGNSEAEKAAMVEACVREVLRILKQQKEA